MQTAAKQPAAALAVAPTREATEQTRSFEQAIELFNSRNFGKAQRHFESASKGPRLEMAYAARLHLRMCEHRLSNLAPAPRTIEERYNYAIALINRRELEAAEQQLQRALDAMENGDHLHYAMALCRGLRGDFEGACRALRRALDLRPRNLTTARNDRDFHEIGCQPLIRDLLFPKMK